MLAMHTQSRISDMYVYNKNRLCAEQCFDTPGHLISTPRGPGGAPHLRPAEELHEPEGLRERLVGQRPARHPRAHLLARGLARALPGLVGLGRGHPAHDEVPGARHVAELHAGQGARLAAQGPTGGALAEGPGGAGKAAQLADGRGEGVRCGAPRTPRTPTQAPSSTATPAEMKKPS